MIRPLLTLLLLCGSVQAANVYVRDGASGSGTSWSDALDDLPGTLVRGNVYYVADGTYAGKDLTTANSGTTLITIQKCSASDHGTETGYSAAYCDGQATFGELRFGSDYWKIDGAYRGSDWGDTASYGFRITGLTSSTAAFPGVCGSNLTFRYIDAGGTVGTSYTGSEPGEALYVGGFDELCTNWTVQYLNLHNISHYTLVQFAGIDTATIEYTRFQNAWGKEAIRGQVAAKNLTLRYNQFYNACGTASPDACTADIAIWDVSTGGADNNKVYGNWFYQTNTNAHTLNTGGTIVIGGNGSSWAGPAANNTLVYNNTITGSHADGENGFILVNGGSGNECRNNLWRSVNNATASCGTTSNNVDAGSNPFVNLGSLDLRLSGATTAGTTLSSPYDIDPDGNTRGADGTWDVGAYEYSAGGGQTQTKTHRHSVQTFVGAFMAFIALGGLYARRNRRGGLGAARTGPSASWAAAHSVGRGSAGAMAQPQVRH